MEPQIYTPTYELFLVLERVRANLDELARALQPIELGPLPTPLGADVYYRRTTDVALLAVRFDERLIDHAGLTWLEELAIGAGIALLDPTRLAESDRRQLYGSYLNTYEVQIEDTPGPRWALSELGRELGVRTPPPPPIASARRGQPRAASVLVNPEDTQVPIFERGDDDSGRAVTEPPLPARIRGKRLGSSPPGVPGRARTEKGIPSSGPVTTVELIDPSELEDAAAPPPPRGKRKQTRRATSPATPLAKLSSGPRPAIDSSSGNPPEIDVRYLRGTDWLPARLRSLSLKGAYLVTGALPRVGDQVHISLGFRGAGAMISGEVYHVTPLEDAAQAGACGFALRFAKDDTPERRQLIKLLRRARDAGVTIKPPPARIAVRFPVRWPVRVSTDRGGLDTAALDVSTGGMFVRTGRDLPGADTMFRVPLDAGDISIRGRARAVRRVTQQMALERGLQTGYGMAITELTDLDRRRWVTFLERIKRRSEKRVIIGGSVGRVRVLGDALLGCGYSVQGASDAGGMLGLIRSGQRPPDAAVLDPTLSATPSDVRRIEAALATLGVPIVSSDRELPARARLTVDRMLDISF